MKVARGEEARGPVPTAPTAGPIAHGSSSKPATPAVTPKPPEPTSGTPPKAMEDIKARPAKGEAEPELTEKEKEAAKKAEDRYFASKKVWHRCPFLNLTPQTSSLPPLAVVIFVIML